MFRTIAILGISLAAAAAAQTAPPTFTLAQAMERARANSPDFQAALVAEGIASAGTTQARAALLPALNYDSSYIYTQAGRYIANNGVHEYSSQGNLHEALDFGSTAALDKARAGEALARAQAEIAARGLAATVTGDYYGFLAAVHKRATAEQALADAQKYLTISQDRERGGEVAHADVLKAQLEVEQRQRDAREAALAEQQAKLGLAVLLFPNFDTNFQLADDLAQAPALPPATQVDAMARQRNPALGAAQAGLQQAQAAIGIARASLLPALSLDYFYGIDAAQFATRNQFGQPNLGSAATGTVAIPIFSWGANRAKLRQSQLQAAQAQRQLRFAQRSLAADLEGFYAEAEAARAELATLLSSRDLAAESLRLTGLRYQDGEATILELVDAQNTATAARNAYDDGLARYRVALANLQNLTGPF
ncbi:MAG TPA: TolC family protein [Terriglobales bacterium]|nr:TolC family protein [Terriglobales bacterium]